MKLISEIELSKITKSINHEDPIMTFGSCFADNIAHYLSERKFEIHTNPFGVLYNPSSVYNAIRLAHSGDELTEDDLQYHMDEWHSFYFHSDFSHHEKETCLKKINNMIKSTNNFINKSNWAFITYGTSFVYNYKKENIIVSNCHKIPGKEFDRLLLTTEQVEKNIIDTINLLKEKNSQLKFIFTVSPVRHWNDGAVDNQLSKSTLIVAIHNVLKKINNNDIFYFPSYEIVMDELRDYRFYKKDLMHPNEIAVQHIWEKFSEYAMSKSCNAIISDMEKLSSSMAHRPRNISSPGYQKFVRGQLKLIDGYKKKYKHLDFSNEIKFFEERLSKSNL